MPTQEFYDEMAKRQKKIKEEQKKSAEFLKRISEDDSMLPQPLPEETKPNKKIQEHIDKMRKEGKLTYSEDLLEGLELPVPINKAE